MEKQTITFNITVALEKLGLPVIVTSADPKGLCFLIDTGATDNVLCEYVYSILKDSIRDSEEQRSFYGIDGNKQIVKRAFMPLTICNENYDVEFNVADLSGSFSQVEAETGIQLHGILGIDFLAKSGWIIDFAKNVIIIPKQVA